MIEVREAKETDVARIREIFLACYGSDYAYPQYYDDFLLKKMIFSDDTLLLVAEETDTGEVLGTASLILEAGAAADLVGEFGRLAVHPDGRQRGIGRLLMTGRLERVEDRLHVGLVENRCAHPYSQKISIQHGFVPVGFIPLKLRLARRESVALFVRHFGQALTLRRNHPRIIPEAHRIAEKALRNCGLRPDVIVDDDSAAYPAGNFRIEELTTEGYASLVRIERGRLRHREIFGPMRLQYGLFNLRARHSNYLLAYDGEELVGAVGFVIDDVDKLARVFELVSMYDRSIRHLLEELVERCRSRWDIEYIEVDVSAHAPRMQRTLLELKFQPVAYVPAMAFHEVERLDVIKMARLLVPPDFHPIETVPETRPFADAVMQSFVQRNVLPQIESALPRIAMFAKLNDEQTRTLATLCQSQTFSDGDSILREGEQDGQVQIVLEGEVRITAGGADQELARLGVGECLGEMSLLASTPHSATGTAVGSVETAVLTHEALNGLVRRRPDIGVILYRNFARGIGAELSRTDSRLLSYPQE